MMAYETMRRMWMMATLMVIMMAVMISKGG